VYEFPEFVVWCISNYIPSKRVVISKDGSILFVGQLVWTVGCHLCQLLEIDVNPWRSLEALDMWLRLMGS
jgi:hypothetical protein